MAKIEFPKKSQRKGKKRKSSGDSALPSKRPKELYDPQGDNKEYNGEHKQFTVSKKRKTFELENSEIRKKVKASNKKEKNYSTTEENDNLDDSEVLREPTDQELLASEKPENVLSVETIRKRKRNRHTKNVEVRKESAMSREILKNELYLRKWKDHRTEWKFEKLRQLSVQSSIFDDEKISPDFWPIALEYLNGTKGAAKEKIIKYAEEEITKLDNQIEATNNKDLVKSVSYRRARELLQSME